MKAKVSQLIQSAAKTLKDKTPTPRLDAEVLFSHMLKVTRAELYQLEEIEWSASKEAKWNKLITARASGQPVAQIVGSREFMEWPFKVSRNVLTPRPETEQIVEEACRLIKQHPTLPIYDIGTGSGAIAVMIAKTTGRSVIASDVSLAALKIAETNAKALGVSSKVRFVKSSLGHHITKPGIVVANLPYLPESLNKDLTLSFEPKIALFSGVDGLDLYRKLFKDLKFKIAVIELGPKQYRPMGGYLKDLYPASQIIPIKDLDGTICGLTLSQIL